MIFLEKGGTQILNVLERIQNKYKNRIKLTIISRIQPDKEFTRTNENDKEFVIRFIEENNNWIKHYKNIDNDKVLEIAKDADIGLLPTIQDTYGYSVLEMQAAGVPCITTNVRALPEINKAGWICKIPINKYGEALYSKETSLNKINKILERELEKTIVEILENPDIIKEKGLRAYNNIKEQHDPIDNGNKLYDVYINALYKKGENEK